MTLRKHLWILLFALFACWVSGCGGGGGSSNNLDPSPDDYILDALSQGRVIHWVRPIGVYMNQTNVPADWRSQDAQFIQDAMTTWRDAAQDKFSFVILTSPTDPCISVTWVKDHPMGENPPTIGVSKLTTSTVGGKEYIQRVNVQLAVDNNGAPMSDATMRLLSLHEIGHAIGIWGHSDNPNDIMFDTLGAQTGLSDRDINTINRLYSLSPDIYELSASKVGITPEETHTITMP